MMEGVSSEAASLAAHQRLSNLCWIYDSNRVTIEGHTNIAFTEDVAARFMAYGWNVTTVADANDLDAIKRAFHTFKAERDRPTIIVVHSHIGYGSPVEDSPKAHGEPFGVEGCKATKRFFGFPEDQDFYVPDGVYDHFAAGIGATGARRATRGTRCSRSTASSTPSSPTRSSASSAETCPTAGRSSLPTFPADEKGHREPRLVGTGAQRDRASGAVGRRWLGRPLAVDEDEPHVRRRRRLPSREPAAGATSTSASASTRRLQSRTAWR